MEDQIISFETAKLAKEKGFNIPTRNFYADSSWDSKEIYSVIEVGYNEFTDSMENNHGFGDITLIPTQSLLQRWLREVQGIHVEATFDSFHKVYYIQLYLKDNHTFHGEDDRIFKTYEEALEKGLIEGLKLIKNG